MNETLYIPIGIIHTPYENIKDIPIQPSAAKGIKGTVKVYFEYKTEVKNLNGFSHIILIYHFHLSNSYQLKVKPFHDDNMPSLFATHAPKRLNNICYKTCKG